MNALILNGGRAADDGADAVQSLLAGELAAAGCRVTEVVLRDCQVDTCKGCFGCWTNSPGVCWIDDEGRRIAEEMVKSDLAVLLTPVTFGGYSSELKKVVDRLIPIISPLFMRVKGETRHRRRYARYPRLLGVGVLPEPDPEQEAVFNSLVERNAMNFHSPGQAGVVLDATEDEAAWRQKIRLALSRTGGLP